MNHCIAHRGWSGRAPENTVAAIQLALNNPSIYGIEIDVHLSKDGVPIVMHDHTVDRTTNGSGRIIDMTVAELGSLDSGSWFGPEFSGEKIPLLEEVLHMTNGRKKLLIELKQAGALYTGLEQKVADMVSKFQLEDEVLIISFDHESLRKIKEYNSRLQTGLIYLGMTTLLAEQATYTRANHLSFHHSFLTKEIVDDLLEKGIEIGAWTINDMESLVRIKALSSKINITTNFPELMI
ncbi:glycerophosphodiester phosphodiesterase [Litchfieldia salsa]|uniref:Glycerophosphoryl diester phosphodiesterase n=1 Tax=Litchfieldia salsa TaxID=930152 RepID=A0A1H0VK12_9BACI|nr:glycerophosphodiester phosphodiesterase family protein [Litchfieldia salsa]SDP78912.1 glycerophosphoryl diester phosphodiesterase [Litchfieldia salsa]